MLCLCKVNVDTGWLSCLSKTLEYKEGRDLIVVSPETTVTCEGVEWAFGVVVDVAFREVTLGCLGWIDDDLDDCVEGAGLWITDVFSKDVSDFPAELLVVLSVVRAPLGNAGSRCGYWGDRQVDGRYLFP